MPTVRFIPSGKIKEIKAGSTLLAAATQSRMPIGQSCSGDGICGWCRVIVVEGREYLGEPNDMEKKLMSEKEFAPNERAACMATVRGNVSITTTYW